MSSSKKPDKYLPENQIWYKQDNFKNCKKDVIFCPKCGHAGHLSTNLNQSGGLRTINNLIYIKRDYYIHHSHFIADLDRGRHVRCKIGDEWVSVNDSSITTTYRSSRPRNVPGWLMDELAK
jgi:hypothetical protein